MEIALILMGMTLALTAGAAWKMREERDAALVEVRTLNEIEVDNAETFKLRLDTELENRSTVTDVNKNLTEKVESLTAIMNEDREYILHMEDQFAKTKLILTETKAKLAKAKKTKTPQYVITMSPKKAVKKPVKKAKKK